LKKEFLLYTVVSAIAWLVDVAVLYFAAMSLGMPHYLSAAIGYTVGLLVHYLLSVRFVFVYRKMAGQWRSEALVYLLTGLLGVVLSAAIVHAGSLLGLPLIISKVIATVITFVAVFAVRKIVLFTSGESRLEKTS
jgi:putative flippase GtrA